MRDIFAVDLAQFLFPVDIRLIHLDNARRAAVACRFDAGSFSTSKGTHWQSYDAGLAGEAFCLAAWEKGLGTVIMGIFEEAKVKETLQIPETESVSALIALGYPEEVPEAPKRKETELLLKIVK